MRYIEGSFVPCSVRPFPIDHSAGRIIRFVTRRITTTHTIASNCGNSPRQSGNKGGDSAGCCCCGGGGGDDKSFQLRCQWKEDAMERIAKSKSLDVSGFWGSPGHPDVLDKLYSLSMIFLPNGSFSVSHVRNLSSSSGPPTYAWMMIVTSNATWWLSGGYIEIH